MPYIKQHKRDVLDPVIEMVRSALVQLELDDDENNMEGNLNYIITKLLRTCYNTNYADINSAIGMLACVQLEHYRTIAGPYETQKCFENGDVEADTLDVHLKETIARRNNNDKYTDDSGC